MGGPTVGGYADALPVPHRTDTAPAARCWARVFGCCRVVFNDALAVRDEAYRAGVKLPDSEIQRRVITEAKTRERPELVVGGRLGGATPVQSVRDAHRAYTNFFDSIANHRRRGRKVGRPRLKTRKDNRRSFRLTRNGFSLRPNGRLYLAKVGEVRLRGLRELPSGPFVVCHDHPGTGRPVLREFRGRGLSGAAACFGMLAVGVDLGYLPAGDSRGHQRRLRGEIANPRHFAGKRRKPRAAGNGRKPVVARGGRNREKSRRKIANSARQTCSCPARPSPQAGLGVDSREPSGLRRGFEQHRRDGSQPPVGAGDPTTLDGVSSSGCWRRRRTRTGAP